MKAREFTSPDFKAVAWLVNQTLHPQGYHFAIVTDDDGTAKWLIMGDGSEAATSTDDNIDFLFNVLSRLKKEARELHG